MEEEKTGSMQEEPERTDLELLQEELGSGYAFGFGALSEVCGKPCLITKEREGLH